jgi:cellobiose phosphorylase
MILNNQIKTQSIEDQGFQVNFLESGDIYDITYQDAQINLLHGNLVDGGYINLYLRILDEENIKYTPLFGRHSPSVFSIQQNKAIYQGVFEGIHYQITWTLRGLRFDLSIHLSSDTKRKIDVMFGLDLAITSKGSVLNSEPYTVQYIDYKVFEDHLGYTLCARQNQGRSQYFQLGSFNKTIGYTTDGFQFFGLSVKETGIPEAMFQQRLVSEIYQYEFAYFALQTERFIVDSSPLDVSFYGLYEPEDHDVIIQPKPIEYVPIEEVKNFNVLAATKSNGFINPKNRINGLSLSNDAWDRLYPEKDQIEKNDQGILSFFTQDHHHVVSKEKELLLERQHGNLLIHGDLEHVSDRVMATTNWMFGVFHSHVVAGNSSFNKLLGDLRNPLNLQTISGLRIYVKIAGIYHLLGIPSVYDMGGATSMWIYQLKDQTITVKSFVDTDRLVQGLTLDVTGTPIEDIIILQQVLMNVNEHLSDIFYEVKDHDIIFYPPQGSMMANRYPELKYRYQLNQDFDFISESDAFGTHSHQGLMLIHIKPTQSLSLWIEATYESTFEPVLNLTYDQANRKGTDRILGFVNHLRLTHPKYQDEMNLLMHTIFWYTHNALIHYASPHGLEQYNGAAWGTRDVCQGPFEFFMANQHYSIAREILLKIYGRQFIENGDFPQWFMFDRYYQIQAHEAHGDIILWPLRALAYYIKGTEDIDILDESVSYMSIEKNDYVDKDVIYHHVKKQIQAIQNSFIPGTYLPCYGGGDWDDTLQPANHDLTKKMVSGWTVALLYDTLKTFSEEIGKYDSEYAKELTVLVQKIKADYQKHMVVDGIPAGFVVFDKEKTYLLHPRDQKTGLKYRLLPLTRSMIAEFVQPKDIKPYLDVITKYLKHPDGVRLMDTTVEYKGGIKTYFTRAETAANFGREIGLQYVHAHIRYIEALTKIGHADEAYEALLVINPILLSVRVKNAYYRQSNMYFSSSDAWFKDRYQARKEFDRVKRGDILVKGGWRLYSSGPGIYLAQLISNILGLQSYHGHLLLDPSLPKHLEGLTVTFEKNKKTYKISYQQGRDQILLNGIEATYQSRFNLYKQPSVLIDQHELESKNEINLIFIRQ